MYSWGIFYMKGIPAININTVMVGIQLYDIVGSVTKVNEHRNHISNSMIAATATARSDTHIRAVGS